VYLRVEEINLARQIVIKKCGDVNEIVSIKNNTANPPSPLPEFLSGNLKNLIISNRDNRIISKKYY